MQFRNNSILSQSYLNWKDSLKINPNQIIAKHYLDYLEIIKTNSNLPSQNLSSAEIQELSNKKYNLSNFDIYKYIYAHDYLTESLSCSKIDLTAGITKDKNKYNNILIDLFYTNIPSELLSYYSIAVVFGLIQKGWRIKDLSNWDKYTLSLYTDYDDLGLMSKDIKAYKSTYKDYGGNSYTYYTFKQLIKLKKITFLDFKKKLRIEKDSYLLKLIKKNIIEWKII